MVEPGLGVCLVPGRLRCSRKEPTLLQAVSVSIGSRGRKGHGGL